MDAEIPSESGLNRITTTYINVLLFLNIEVSILLMLPEERL